MTSIPFGVEVLVCKEVVVLVEVVLDVVIIRVGVVISGVVEVEEVDTSGLLLDDVELIVDVDGVVVGKSVVVAIVAAGG